MAGESIMIDSCKKWGPLVSVGQHCPVTFGDGRLLVAPHGKPCEVVVEAGAAKPQAVHLGSDSVVLTHVQRARASFLGERGYRLIDENRLCQLLAFVDLALPATHSQTQTVPTAGFFVHPVPNGITHRAVRLEHWLTAEVMRGNADNSLLSHLRSREAYRLVNYLLKMPPGHTRLNTLCVRYGLSYSHFRRLCQRALGSAVKPRLREWRAARSILDLLVGEQAILEVALENGYASASHISNDIKRIFGITPRMAKNAHSLLP